MTAQAPAWWAASGIHSTKGHLVRGPIGTTARAACGKRPNPGTGWISPPRQGANCKRCAKVTDLEARR